MSLDKVQDALGYAFGDLGLLEQALTHSSHAHEQGTDDYERLEFLGDAVLQMCTTLMLIEAFPTAREGELSRLRSKLVNTRTLAGIARELDLGAALRLGRGEAETGGRRRTSNLADAAEAVLGAIYKDSGFSACREVVTHWMTPRIAALDRSGDVQHGWKDPRSRLQELTQQNGGKTPAYEVVEREGPPHQPIFHVLALLGDAEIGRGSGKSKRAGARAAAEDALRRLGESP